MARRSGNSLVINVSAGTAQLVTDLEGAKGKVVQFGSAVKGAGNSTRNSMIEASGVIRGVKLDFDHNIRAVERFTATTLGLAPVFKALFPVVGALSLGVVLFEMGDKVREFFKTLGEAPSKMAAAFRQANAPIKQTNDDMRVAIDRLENDIAKLEGRRQNTVKLALDEAVKSADKLAESLQKDLAALTELLKKQEIGMARKLFGEEGTSDLERLSRKLEIGVGNVTEQFSVKIAKAAAAKDTKGVASLRKEENERVARLYDAALAEIDEKSKQAPTVDVLATIAKGGVPVLNDNSDRNDQLRRFRQIVADQKKTAPLSAELEAATKRKEELEANKANSEIGRPLRDTLRDLDAKIAATKLRLAAIGKDEEFQIVARGAAAAIVEIEKVNKLLEHQHKAPLTPQDEAAIRRKTEEEARLQTQETWNTKLDEATKRIKDEVLAQELLTAAVGRGYEAVKKANIQSELMKMLGADLYNKHKNTPELAGLIEGRDSADDAKAKAEAKNATQSLNDQIRLETLLAAVQIQGAEAVRYKTLQLRLEILQRDKGKDITQAQIDAEYALYEAHRKNEAADDLGKLNQRIEAVKRLTLAQQDGAEAARKQELENKYADIRHQRGASPETEAIIKATRAEDEGQHEKDITKKVSDRVNVHKDLLETLRQEQANLEAQLKDRTATVEEERTLVAIQQERLKIAVEESLAGRTAKDGIRAFFIEMQEQGKSAAESVYQALNSALDRTADQFARLITGQKTNFKAAFQEVGAELLKDQIKSGLQKGVGAIGKLLGITGKRDGSSATSALFVEVVNGGGLGRGAGNPLEIPDLSGANAGHAENLGIAGGILGILGRFGGGFAEGGDVSPGMAYLVGERGPELFSPSTHGTITSNSSYSQGGLHIGYLDARGADLGAGNRVSRAIEAAHASAVSTGVRANIERQRRTPQRN